MILCTETGKNGALFTSIWGKKKKKLLLLFLLKFTKALREGKFIRRCEEFCCGICHGDDGISWDKQFFAP